MTAPAGDGGVLTLIRDTVNGSRGFTAWSGRRMYLYTEDGANSFTFDLAPSEIDYGDLGAQWVETDRPGTTPLLQYKGQKLATMKFTFTMSDRTDYFQTQNNAINALQQIAGSTQRVMVRYSAAESGLWRIKDLTIKSMYRHPATNDPIRCTADITMQRAMDADPTGPVGGSPLSTSTVAKSAPRSYTVKANQTLGSISQEVYGTPLLWQRIYDANPQLVMPWDISAGMVLLVP